jgi:signal transduction histidine kinase/CheY-like chemotaxis protein
MSHVAELPDAHELRLSICEAADFREAADLVLKAAMQLPGIDAVGIYAFDSNHNFHLVSYSGVSSGFAERFRHFPFNSPQSIIVMRGNPVYFRVVELPPDRAAIYGGEGFSSFALYPIKHKGEVVGSLHLGSRHLPEIPQELCAQLEVFVQSLANNIARITYEAMVHKAYEDLEAKVAHRTLELQALNTALRKNESKLQSTADALEDAQRRKDDFIAMLGHELRNPLAPIRNVVHYLKLTRPADARIQRSYDMIERQVSHMARLIDDLLDVSRISHGKIQLKKTRLDIAHIVRTSAEDFCPLMQNASLQFDVRITVTPVWVLGDAARLQQIVANLLSNAMKFTDPGGTVVLTLSVHATCAEIAVEDTGIGMEPGVLNRIFDPFCQADQSPDRSRGGLGLGLALVKGLTELHDGHVRAESTGIGRGTQLKVQLPLETPVTPSPGEAALQRPSEAGATRRVLVIEDNVDAADSLQILLSMLGHEVALAYTGSDGLAKADLFKPDVILCDIGLPGSMDGYAVARALRGTTQFARVILIAMTGYGQDEDRRRAHQAGFDCHLTKPVNPEVLQDLLVRG